MTTVLALDTATEACSVALWHQGQSLSNYAVIPRLHAQELLPMIKALLAEAQLPMSAIDVLAFGRGPGAFTGVRIATGMVQGLALALDRPVLAVSNLAMLAQRAWRERGAQQVATAIDARMDEVYWGCYQLQDEIMQLVGSEAVLAPELVALPERWCEAECFGAGTGWGYAERLAVKPSACDAALLPHAEDLLRLALHGWANGEALDAADAQPVYLRDKVATPKKQP